MTHFHDPYRPHSLRGDAASPEDAAAPEAPAPAEPELQVPSGTTKEVLDWVGEDKERARAALNVEKDHDKPRKGVVNELESLLDADDDDEEEDNDEK